MVGTRDRVPYGIGLSSEISAGSLAGGGPARVPIRFPRYPVFKVPGASYSPRPAASFRPRRKEIYYAHPIPRSRGNRAFFPGRGASGACFPHMTWDDALLSPFGPRTHSLHKPRKGGAGGENATLHLGALRRRGAPRRREIPSALRRRPLLCKEAGRLSCAQPLK